MVDLLHFDSDQYTRLAEMGVTDEKIISLRLVLDDIATAVAPSPRLSEVKDGIDKIRNDTSRFQESLNDIETLQELLRHPLSDFSIVQFDENIGLPANALKYEISDRITQAEYELNEHGTIEQIKNLLPRMINIINQELVNIPRDSKGNLEQKRRRSASWQPIKKIHDILNRWSHRSAEFEELVGICYAAAGQTSVPERALRAYDKHLRKVLGTAGGEKV